MSYNFVNTSFFDTIYGDGSRGDATITGTTTMAEDRYYNNLTITSTGVLNPNNYKIFVKEKLEIQSGGSIRYNGNNAAGSGQGASVNITGTVRSFGRRGSGGVIARGSNLPGSGSDFSVTTQPAPPAATTSSGWNGGNGGAATLVGGTGNPGFQPTNAGILSGGTMKGLFYLLKTGYFGGGPGGFLSSEFGCGPGGGGGACDAGNAATDYGGAGGGGGPGIIIFAKEIVNNGTIEAKGGNGSAGAHATAKAGGGGGGAGGVIVTVCRFPTKLGTRDVSGGTGGAGAGGGSAGSQGNTGLVMSFNC